MRPTLRAARLLGTRFPLETARRLPAVVGASRRREGAQGALAATAARRVPVAAAHRRQAERQVMLVALAAMAAG